MGGPLEPKSQVELSREDFRSFANLPFCFWKNRAGERRGGWSWAIILQGLGIEKNNKKNRSADGQQQAQKGIEARR